MARIDSGSLAEEPTSAPAQPQGEAEVARQFEAAAQDLFQEWLERRPETLKALTVGRQNQNYPFSFEFTHCEDSVVPMKYSIDVKKTDSILTPFLGQLLVPVKLACTNRILQSGKMPRAIEDIAPRCIGATYDECLAAGAKPPSGFAKANGMPWAIGNGMKVKYEDTVVVSYVWRQGKWEFKDEKAKPPTQQSQGGRDKGMGK